MLLSAGLDAVHYTSNRNGGQGWTRTNDVTGVPDLQSGAFATRLPTHINSSTPSHNLLAIFSVSQFFIGRPGITWGIEDVGDSRWI